MIDRKIDLISPNIKAYILSRMKYLTCNPAYYIGHGSMTKSRIEEEVNRHSVSIELVDFDESNSESRKIKQREKHRCERNLREARKWALQNYSLPLTKTYIELVGSLVDPLVNDQGFRKDKVRISDSLCSPPSLEKLDREFTIFLWENEGIKEPLEKAIHSHFGIARVHPFNDGNGRTARLVQDVMLSSLGFPLPMIPMYERPEYIQKIEEAISSYYEREGPLQGRIVGILSDLRKFASNSDNLSQEQLTRGKYLARLMLSLKITPEQNTFYDFIALKIFNGLSEKLKGLYPSREHMMRYFKKKKRHK